MFLFIYYVIITGFPQSPRTLRKPIIFSEGLRPRKLGLKLSPRKGASKRVMDSKALTVIMCCS